MRGEAEQMGLDLEVSLNSRDPLFNIAPTQLAPVLMANETEFEVKALRWGLVPAWAKDAKIGARAINARAETVAEKPMFRAAFKKRRCLVASSGYFEWQRLAGQKQPFFIHDPSGELLMFAGLWEVWRASGDAEWLRTFTIVTGDPGKVSGDIHDRQPVIIPADLMRLWITGTPDDAQAVLAAVPEASLSYYPVPKAVGSPRNKGPELVEPITLE
jgi:putative SOS response-associated peptidase YedK